MPTKKTTDTRRQKLIVLIHGIHSRLSWAESLEKQLKDAVVDDVVVKAITYNWVSAAYLLLPRCMHAGSIGSVESEIIALTATFPEHEIHVIAHSFGTYATLQALADNSQLRIHQLILCGAIVGRDFDLSRIERNFTIIKDNPKQRPERIINVIANRDIWPVVARATSNSYGEAGRVGLRTALARDLVFKGSHNLFSHGSVPTKVLAPIINRADIRTGQTTLSV
ncbi:MAG TPA: hypothetical protein VGN57_16285 [Pirellulaceae bacterium]|jgi:pimeloyl-ACP methyl ester carboxylesterase|nr:hypothetical protein [Pirellulaceae bacterium]